MYEIKQLEIRQLNDDIRHYCEGVAADALVSVRRSASDALDRLPETLLQYNAALDKSNALLREFLAQQATRQV